MKKPLDTLGAIAAWLLSMVLVVTLLVTPILFSTLSLLNANTVTKVVSGLLTTRQNRDEASYVEAPRVQKLSNVTKTADTPADVSKGALSDLFGDELTPEQISAILDSKAAKELLDAYTEELTGALAGDAQASSFDAEKIKSIVNENIDEIVDVLQKNVPELAGKSAEELKQEITKTVNENADKIIEALPDPAELKQQLTEENPALEIALTIIGMRDTIKLLLIGAIVVLSGLVFACRLPGTRGFSWLAVDLFTAGGLGMLITVALKMASSALGSSIDTYGADLVSLVGVLLGSFTTGMFVRYGVMLAFGGILLTAYILLKKIQAKKHPVAQW
jgi:hypothetical protein